MCHFQTELILIKKNITRGKCKQEGVGKYPRTTCSQFVAMHNSLLFDNSRKVQVGGTDFRNSF